jgi:G3E family GTPase
MASFAVLIKSFCRETKPDFLFIEPSSMVTTQELSAAAASGLRDCSYHIGPFITLVDGPEFEATWAERQMLLRAQISGADLVAVSRVDMLEKHQRDRILEILKQDTEKIIELSTLQELGTEFIVDVVNPNGSLSESNNRESRIRQ